MKNDTSFMVELSYRTLYGKLFAALFSHFGIAYTNEIEDAIQNAFYKALKAWKPDKFPDNKANWLFIVAKNDLLNQIKRQQKRPMQACVETKQIDENLNEDLRLKTILLLSKSQKVSYKAKVLFILKNIFGLHIKEISAATLIAQEAIYKSINRAKGGFKLSLKNQELASIFELVSEEEIAIVEEILYAVFNIGFDSFREKNNCIVDEDLCLEALALSKLLSDKFGRNSTKNLLALFCFHIARIPEKIKKGKIIAFFEQDKTQWNNDFIRLGFHYFEKPNILNKYYIESLIVSKHMTAKIYDATHWSEIIQLYKIMLTLSDSPIVKLNLCYSLSKLQKQKEAIALLEEVERELPQGHFYFSLLKANILDNTNNESEKLIHQALENTKQKIRREYILENMSLGF